MNRHLKVEVRKLKSGRSLFLVPQARSSMRTFLIPFRALVAIDSVAISLLKR